MNAYYLSLLKEIQKQIDDKSYQTAYDLIHQELELPYVPKEAMEVLEEYQKECLSHMDRPVRSADDEQLQAWIQGSLQQQEKAVSLLQNLNLRNYHDEVQTLLDSKILDEYKGEFDRKFDGAKDRRFLYSDQKRIGNNIYSKLDHFKR